MGIQLLAGAASSGRIAGVDPSEEMIEQACARNARPIEAGKVELREGAVGHLPYADATFDKAMAINSSRSTTT